MIQVRREGIILEKTNLDFENEAVFNPAAIREGDFVHLFYRAVRRGNNSTIGYCKLKEGLKVVERMTGPILFPEFDYEAKGVEDPRIVRIDDMYYMTYTAYDNNVALGALAISTDLVNFTKKGVIVPKIFCDEFHNLAFGEIDRHHKYFRYNKGDHIVWNKNVIFFPRRINGKLWMLHRIRPDIQIFAINELDELDEKFWENYFREFDRHILMAPKFSHEVSYIGGGCPPIETEEGWLLIYHSVHDTVNGYIYSACAALIDLENPKKEISRLPYPLFAPEEEWEKRGVVDNVCFPTGAALFDDKLYIYYGAADERIACATVSVKSLLKELLLNKIKD